MKSTLSYKIIKSLVKDNEKHYEILFNFKQSETLEKRKVYGHLYTTLLGLNQYSSGTLNKILDCFKQPVQVFNKDTGEWKTKYKYLKNVETNPAMLIGQVYESIIAKSIVNILKNKYKQEILNVYEQIDIQDNIFAKKSDLEIETKDYYFLIEIKTVNSYVKNQALTKKIEQWKKQLEVYRHLTVHNKTIFPLIVYLKVNTDKEFSKLVKKKIIDADKMTINYDLLSKLKIKNKDLNFIDSFDGISLNDINLVKNMYETYTNNENLSWVQEIPIKEFNDFLKSKINSEVVDIEVII